MTILTIDEGISEKTGVRTKFHFEDDNIVVQKTVDMEPYLERARLAREATDGQRWGDGRTVGTLPPDVYAQVLMIRDTQERRRFIRNYFKQNPQLVHFERYVK